MSYTRWQPDWRNDEPGATPIVEGFLDQVETTFVIQDGRLTAIETLPNAKGDLVGATADNTLARVPAGTVDGYVLTRNATAPTGMKWSAPTGGSGGGSAAGPGVFDVVAGYGADPTGVIDSYMAFINWAAAIRSAGGGVGIVPPGVYTIDQYRITGGPNLNTIQDIRFDDCHNFSITGYGAVINVKGNFNRATDNGSNSFESSIIPFLFANCSNFELAGFEINGNVQLMTRGGATDEGPCYGIFTAACVNYTIRDIYVHHFATDGIALGFDHAIADKQAFLYNVKSLYNARQGMSISQVSGASVVACEFSQTGRSAGTYGGHPPMAGVDIEPNFTPSTTPAVDVITGMITFDNCLFKNNTNSQFINSLAYAIQKIRLQNCAIIADQSTNAFTVVMAIDDGLLDGCYIDTNGQRIALTWGSPLDPLQNTRMRNCLIKSKDAFLATDVDAPVVVEDCRFISTTTTTRALTASIYIINRKCVFKNNYVFFPAVAYSGSGTFDIAIILQYVRLADGNYYETDMNPSAAQHFAIDYSGATIVQNEVFRSGGVANSGFRPVYNSTWDTLNANYAIGYPTVGQGVGFNINEVNNFIVMVPGMPTFGGWNKGDIAFNTNPTRGGFIGWTRLTTSFGNVLNTDWQPFGLIDTTPSGGGGGPGGTVGSTFTGTTANGDPWKLWIPTGSGAGTPLVHFAHPYGGDHLDPDSIAIKPLLDAVMGAGWALVAADYGGQAWGAGVVSGGNTRAVETCFMQVDAAAKAAVTSPVTLVTKLAWGGSMGCLNLIDSFRYETGVTLAGLYVTCGVFSIADPYAGAFAAAINAPYNIPAGGTYAAQTAGRDPNLATGTQNRGPTGATRFRYQFSCGDQVCHPYANARPFVASFGGTSGVVEASAAVAPDSAQHYSGYVLGSLAAADFVKFGQRAIAGTDATAAPVPSTPTNVAGSVTSSQNQIKWLDPTTPAANLQGWNVYVGGVKKNTTVIPRDITGAWLKQNGNSNGTTWTDPTAAPFLPAHVGQPFYGQNVPAGTTISAVVSGAQITLSQSTTVTDVHDILTYVVPLPAYTITGLSPSTVYSATVRSVTWDGVESVDSTAVSFSTTSGGPAPTLPITDNFNRADSTTTLGSTPGGVPWVVLTAGATWGISSNQAYNVNSVLSHVVVDSGVSDCTVQMDIDSQGGFGPLFRATDDLNGFVLNLAGTAGFYQQVGGTFTQLGTNLADTGAGTWKIVMSGSSFTVYKNGTQVGTYTSTFNQTATRHGMRCGTATTRFDNLSITVP